MLHRDPHPVQTDAGISHAGRCRHCGSPRLFEVACERGPHAARVGCGTCGRHVGFAESPWTVDRARAFRLWFGKHKGRTLGTLAETPEGLSYVRWLAGNVEGNAGAAARVLLDGEGRAVR